MKHGKDETAMYSSNSLKNDIFASSQLGRYSLHVLGLAFDGRDHVAYLCDPNGSLLPGGNM